jgi:putative transposase
MRCCYRRDREILAYRAWEGKGLPGEPVREMLIEAVEKRFGGVEGVPSTHALEFLSDNGAPTSRPRLDRSLDNWA